MKTLWHLFLGLLIIHVLAAIGFVGWMYSDNRLNTDRVNQVVDIFRLTIEEEAEQKEEAAVAEAEAKKKQEQLAWLQATGEGPKTLRDELDETNESDEAAQVRLELINTQNKALREEMARFKADHARRVAELEAERQAFEDMVERRAEQLRDDNFQQVVALYQTQPPKQTKEAFQALMLQGETEQVVEYLAAMSNRAAGKVLSQFKAPDEVVQAADLLERLRTRDEFTMDDAQGPAGNAS